MYCASCGAKWVNGAAFCPNCGAPALGNDAANLRRRGRPARQERPETGKKTGSVLLIIGIVLLALALVGLGLFLICARGAAQPGGGAEGSNVTSIRWDEAEYSLYRIPLKEIVSRDRKLGRSADNGTALEDLDGDGVRELIVLDAAGEQVCFSIYSIKDRKLTACVPEQVLLAEVSGGAACAGTAVYEDRRVLVVHCRGEREETHLERYAVYDCEDYSLLFTLERESESVGVITSPDDVFRLDGSACTRTEYRRMLRGIEIEQMVSTWLWAGPEDDAAEPMTAESLLGILPEGPAPEDGQETVVTAQQEALPEEPAEEGASAPDAEPAAEERPAGTWDPVAAQVCRVDRMYQENGYLISVDYTIHEYDEAGRLVKTTDYFETQDPIVTIYFYDAQGRLIRSEEGEYGPVLRYEYDDRGRLIRLSTGYGDWIESYSEYYYEGDRLVREDCYFWDSYASSRDYEYEGGRLVKKSSRVNGTVAGDLYVYAYDAEGRLIREDYYYDPDTLMKQTTYAYDAKGRPGEKNVYDGQSGQLLERETCAYGVIPTVGPEVGPAEPFPIEPEDEVLVQTAGDWKVALINYLNIISDRDQARFYLLGIDGNGVPSLVCDDPDLYAGCDLVVYAGGLTVVHARAQGVWYYPGGGLALVSGRTAEGYVSEYYRIDGGSITQIGTGTFSGDNLPGAEDGGFFLWQGEPVSMDSFNDHAEALFDVSRSSWSYDREAMTADEAIAAIRSW